jgi:hypothetical protein
MGVSQFLGKFGNILKTILTYFQILVNFLVTSRRPLTPILPFYRYVPEEGGNRGGGILPFQGGGYQSIKVIVFILTPSFPIPVFQLTPKLRCETHNLFGKFNIHL